MCIIYILCQTCTYCIHKFTWFLNKKHDFQMNYSCDFHAIWKSMIFVLNVSYMIFYKFILLSINWCMIMNARCPDVAFIDKSIEYRSTAGQGPFHTHFKVWVLLIVEDPTMTVKCRSAIKALSLYLNLCPSGMLDVHLHPYPFLLNENRVAFFPRHRLYT